MSPLRKAPALPLPLLLLLLLLLLLPLVENAVIHGLF